MLSVAENYLHKLNADAELLAFGQEINDQTFAICKADMLIKGNDATQIRSGTLYQMISLPTKPLTIYSLIRLSAENGKTKRTP